jgi:hypothetical protein
MKYIRALITWIWLLFAKEQRKKEAKSFMPPLNLQYFADGGDGGDDGGDGESGSGDDSDDEPFATFKSKDDLNKRLGRAEKKGQKALAQQLGYDSVEAMQEALNKDKKEDKNDKDKDKKEDPVDVDALLESKLKEEREKTFKRLRNSEVKVQAKELGFADWEDALALADLSEVKEDDKGNIVGVKESLDALAKKKPHLLKQQSNGSFGASVPNTGSGSSRSKEDIKKMAQSRGSSQNTAYNPWAN